MKKNTKKPAKKATPQKAVKKVAPKKAVKSAQKVAPKAAPKKAAKPTKKVAPKPVVKKAAKPAPKPVAKKVAKPAPKPVAKKAAKPAPKPAAKKVAKPAPKPVAKKVVKPAPKPVAKKQPVAKPAPVKPAAKEVVPAKPIAKPVEKKVAPKAPVIEVKEVKQEEETTPVVNTPPVIKRPENVAKVMAKNLDDRTRYNDEELGEFKELIQKKLESARNEYSAITEAIQSIESSGYLTLEDGSTTEEKERLSQMAARQKKYIENLENALIRVENKTYGICKVTGKLISKERLRAVPHTTQSIEAKLQQYK